MWLVVTPRPSLTNPHALRAMRDRAIAAIWQRCRPQLAFLAAILLAFLGCRFGLAVEVPDRIVAALVQVESGCTWHGIGDIRGRWSRGAAGEVSAFQLTEAALTDMGALGKRDRVHRDPVLAESLARLWLSRGYRLHGNWADALAWYNRQSDYRSASARDYAQRILNLASVL